MVLIYTENIHSSNRFWENQNYYTINMDYILNKIETVDLFNAYGLTDTSHMTKRFQKKIKIITDYMVINHK